MKTGVRGTFGIKIEDDQRDKDGALPQGIVPGREILRTAWWLTSETPDLNDGDFAFEVHSSTRRHLLIISAANHVWTTKWSNLDFGFDGGEPTAPIDFSALPEGPFSADNAYQDETRGLTILTDRFPPGNYRVEGLTGAGLFIEAEEEEAHRVYPGTASNDTSLGTDEQVT